MRDSFDAAAYASYVKRRWRFVAAVCGVAIAGTLAVSLLLPKRYTATASILIEMPAGNDVRTATAVSPIYLESLRTYEYFAASDSLFRRALEHFRLRDSGSTGAIESLKRQVLKVTKVRDTRILEISATLHDPKLAQAFVQFLAEQTVALNRDLAQAGDRDLIADAVKQQAEAKTHLEQLQTAWTDLDLKEPISSLRTEIDELSVHRARVRRDLLDAQADAAEEQPAGNTERSVGLRARVMELTKQEQSVIRELQAKSDLLTRRSKGRDLLQAQLRSAESGLEAATARLREVNASSGFRGERLRIVDPGIPPERPSSPNIPLNLLIAFTAAFIGSLLFLAVQVQRVPAIPRDMIHRAAR